jgi:hypothetical protein
VLEAILMFIYEVVILKMSYQLIAEDFSSTLDSVLRSEIGL